MAAPSPTGLRDQFERQLAACQANPYPPVSERRANLKRLEEMVVAHQDDLARAIDADFGCRSRSEVLFSEIFTALNEVRHARRHAGEWMQRRDRPISWPLQPARAWVLPQPLGVVGIVVPWNYPVFLSIGPLAGALAAGNRVMMKPSEFTPETSALLGRLIGETFPPDLVTVVIGDAELGGAFVALPFHHLLFTGSTTVGRSVMGTAAANLTPVTLELGGKSPALIADDADLRRAAEDITYGKLLNAGQTCIAPDYVLAPAARVDEFIEATRQAIVRYYPAGVLSPDYTSIINERHYQRLQGYVEEARASGVRIVAIGGEADAGRRKIPPTLLIDPPDNLGAMRDEIFGPILPVKGYRTLSAAIDWVNAHPRPLALYLFARSGRTIERVLTETVSGGVTVNDTLFHIVAGDLPFGGAGASGMGHYHGREGFDTFSKLKPVFRRRWPGLGRLLRPPYGRVHEWMRRLLIG